MLPTTPAVALRLRPQTKKVRKDVRQRVVGKKNEEAWKADARNVLGDAELARDMLEGEARPDQTEDPSRRATV